MNITYVNAAKLQLISHWMVVDGVSINLKFANAVCGGWRSPLMFCDMGTKL